MAWTPPSGATWNDLDLITRQSQSTPLTFNQGDDNKINAENALNWLGTAVMSYSYINGLSITGNPTNTATTISTITASADNQILRRSGLSIGFGSIDLSQSGTVGVSVLGTINGGTGLNIIGTAGQVIRVNSGGTGLEYGSIDLTGYVPYIGASQDLNMGAFNITAVNLTSTALTASRIVVSDASKNLTSLSGTGFIKITSGVISLDTTTYFSNPMTTIGDIIYGGVAGVATRLAKGTTATFLTAGASIPEYFDLFGTSNNWTGTQSFLSIVSTNTNIQQTTGSIPFTATGGNLAQNNANLFWDNTNLRLGIGASSSLLARIHIQGIGTGTGGTFYARNSDASREFQLLDNGQVSFYAGSGNPTFRYSATGYNSAANILLSTLSSSVTPLASMHIRSSGTTDSTFGLRVETSAGIRTLSLTDSGLFRIGGSTATSTGRIKVQQNGYGTYYAAGGIMFEGSTSDADQLWISAISSSQIGIGSAGRYVKFTNDFMTVGDSAASGSAAVLNVSSLSSDGLPVLRVGGTFSNPSTNQADNGSAFSHMSIYTQSVTKNSFNIGSSIYLGNTLNISALTLSIPIISISTVVNHTFTTSEVKSYGIYHRPTLTAAYNYISCDFSTAAAYAPNAGITDYKWSIIAPEINLSVINQTVTALDIVLTGANGFAGGTRNALRVTGGNIVINSIGNGLWIKSGTDARVGTATLVGGTVTIVNTSITANTLIFWGIRGTPANSLSVSATVNGTSFTISSSSPADTRTFDWFLIEKI